MKNISAAVLILAAGAASLRAQTIGEAVRLQGMPLNAAIVGGLRAPAPGAPMPMAAAGLELSAPPLTPTLAPAVSLEPAAPVAILADAQAASAALPEGSAGDAGRLQEFAKTFDGTAAAKPAKGVSTDWVRSMIEKDQAVDPQSRRLRDVVQRLGFAETALNRGILAKHNESYTVELSRGPITDQKQSGRCWIFAGLNMVRSMMLADEKTPKDLELSENYLHFFNMLEKANSHLEDVGSKIYKRHAKSERFDASKRRMVLTPKIGDGGWYEYFAFLVSKYGMVPKAAMGETISSEKTAVLLKELDASLAATSAQMLANAKLYKAGKAGNRSADLRERGMARIWKILSTHLGNPPASFEYRENEKPATVAGIKTTPTKVTAMTPQEFSKNVAKFNAEDYVSVTSYPGKKPDAVYEIKKSAIGAVRAGEPKYDLRFMNVAAERMEALAAAAIKGGQPVWFAADISRDGDRATGILHPKIFDRDPVYQFSKDEAVPSLSRKAASYFQQVSPNHAMLLTGYDQPDPNGAIVKFKVENSWGNKTGAKGIYHLYHEWFLENVFEVVVHKKFLNEAEQARWAGPAKVTKNKD